MDGTDTETHLHHPFKFTPLLIGLIGIVVGSVMVALYQCIAIGYNHNRGTGLSPTPFQLRREQRTRPNTVRTTGRPDVTTTQAMPVFKHTKESREDTCAVCLCEFGEGEEIRTLPQCMHSYHAPCIDMWLYSHANCPLCRTHTSRLPPPPPPPPPPQHLALAVPSPNEVPSPEPERSAVFEEA